MNLTFADYERHLDSIERFERESKRTFGPFASEYPIWVETSVNRCLVVRAYIRLPEGQRPAGKTELDYDLRNFFHPLTEPSARRGLAALLTELVRWEQGERRDFPEPKEFEGYYQKDLR